MFTTIFVFIFKTSGYHVECDGLCSRSNKSLRQGASDWYMRFHSNFKFIKRNVAAPETKSFIVKSDIRNRYAITEVTSVVFNPANVNQTYNFGFVMPEQALVSDVSITRWAKI